MKELLGKRLVLLKEWWKKYWGKPWFVYTAIGFIVFIGVAYLLGDGWVLGPSLRTGIEPAFNIFAVIGGLYALLLATNWPKIADKQASIAQAQVAATQNSNHAQRYEKASEMLWHREEAGIREAGCYALKSLGLDDVEMAFQCRDLLVSFIQRSAPTPKQKEDHQEELSRSDIVAADYALSSMYKEWCHSEEFRSFPLKNLPVWFWREGEASLRRGYPKANLSNANLREANLSEANLSHADLRKANLSRADLSEARLMQANLSGANLSRAGLLGAFFVQANLSNANLREANLREADLVWADLSNANLCAANLSEAKLCAANLSEAKLCGANLSRANFSKANLSRANLSEADFRGDGSEVQTAKNVTPEQIESAVWDRALGPPKLPDYLKDVDVDEMGEQPPSV